jgi:hypothetical protein
MALGDAKVKEFATKLIERLGAYQTAQMEVANNSATGESRDLKNQRLACAMALKMVQKAIKDVAEIE